ALMEGSFPPFGFIGHRMPGPRHEGFPKQTLLRGAFLRPSMTKWAMITGASSGIGEATARALAARGYALKLVARRGERLDALADSLAGAKTQVVPLDIRDAAALRLLDASHPDLFGEVDV